MREGEDRIQQFVSGILSVTLSHSLLLPGSRAKLELR